MDVTSYALSKKYTQETSSEFGAVKGANCQISNTEIDSDGNTVITLKCNKCNSNNLYTEKKNIHTGIYCGVCGAFIKWGTKDY